MPWVTVTHRSTWSTIKEEILIDRRAETTMVRSKAGEFREGHLLKSNPISNLPAKCDLTSSEFDLHV